MKLKKHNIYLILGLFLISIVFGARGNVTTFDDGTNYANITSSKSKNISIVVNATIEQAYITLQGINKTTKYCYQEFDNESTACGGLSTGNYISANISTNDGNYSSYGYNWTEKDGGKGIGPYNETWTILYSNYSVPGFASNDTLWQVKTSTSFANHTLPQICLDQNLLFLKLEDPANCGLICTSSTLTGSCYNGTGWHQVFQDGGFVGLVKLYEEAIFWGVRTYPESTVIQVNQNTIFNHTGNLTGTNSSIDLNQGNVLTSCYQNNQKCPINISFTGAILNYRDLNIVYNKTNSAVVSITNPVEISKSLTGGNYQVYIEVMNVGDWTASDCFFETVSSGTPNLNDDLAFSNFTISINETKNISLTFTNIQQSAEPDESLHYFCRGTDNGNYVYSNFIDVDITYTNPGTGENTGGGGGSGEQQQEPKFEIYGVNAFNTETTQLGIRPNSVREYCLDIVNTASVTQTIYVECDLPTGQKKNTCAWITFKCKNDENCLELEQGGLDITVLPSSETRETFCMNIRTPIDIQVGERYIANIKGTVKTPAIYKDLEQVHAITMFVTDPAIVLSTVWEKFNENTIAKEFYIFIEKYISKDINEIEIKNIYNPFIWLSHILMIIFIAILFRKQNFLIQLFGQVVMIIFSTVSVFYPVILIWIYILLIVLIVWTLILKRSTGKNRKRK